MNILHTETLAGWGGQQNRILTEAVGLSNKGHKVIIACHRGSVLAEKSKKAGIPVREVNMVKKAHLVNVPRLIGIIRKENIDIVSTHSSVDSWAGGIAARLAGRALVRFRHNLYSIGKDPLTRLIYSLPDGFIAISGVIGKVLSGHGIKSEKMTVIPSSVNAGAFDHDVPDLREELNIRPDEIVIGNTSTFNWTKGQKFLMQAFNIIHSEFPCTLLLAGNLAESKKSKYLDHVSAGIRDKVMLLGHREDVPRVLKTLDVFVFPSLLEGLGTALLEAMTMGRAVAVSDIPTFRDFIRDNEEGVFFKAEDPADLAEKVLMLIRNKETREALGRKARAYALENFSDTKMIELTESYYKKIIGTR